MNQEDIMKYIQTHGKLPEGVNFADIQAKVKQDAISTGKRLYEYFNLKTGDNKVLQGAKFKLKAGKFRR